MIGGVRQVVEPNFFLCEISIYVFQCLNKLQYMKLLFLFTFSKG